MIRSKSKAKNQSVYLQNRLTKFTDPPMRIGDLYVEKNETVGGNLDVCGNLTVGKDLTATNFYARGNYYLNNYILIPAGTIIQSASINEPEGWFDCDGRILNLNIYSNLFNAIRYTYGGSDSSFNIPDTRGRSCIGLGNGAGLTNRTLGMSGGSETHTLITGEMPIHSHTGTTDSIGAHTHTSNATGGTLGLAFSDGNNTVTSADVTNGELNVWTTPRALSIDSAGSHNHTFTTNNTGSGTAHNNMQPFIVFRYLIKY
jgi:microcystin-dependent protein